MTTPMDPARSSVASDHHDPFAQPGALTPTGAAPIVRAVDLQKFYGSNHVLKGVTLEVFPRETICLIGKSGSGKSTLLRCINFLEEPTVGSSRKLMQRRRVHLPEPDLPIRQIVSRG